MMGLLIGTYPIASPPNSYYSVTPSQSYTAPFINADYVRSVLRLPFWKYDNRYLSVDVNAAILDVERTLSDWGLSTYDNLSASMKELVREYFAYWVGERIFTMEEGKEKQLANIQKLKSRIVNQIVPPMSTGKSYELANQLNSNLS